MSVRRNGYGLMEVLIAVALAVLLLLMLHRFLVAILQGSSQNSVEVHLSRQAHLLATRMERDLKETDGSGLSFVKNSTLTAIAICKRDGLGPDGTRLYEQALRIYFWTPQTKQVRLFDLGTEDLPAGLVGDVTRAVHLHGEDLAAIVGEVPSSKLVAASVVEFEPIQEWPPQAVTKLTVRLEQATGGVGRKADYELTREVGFR